MNKSDEEKLWEWNNEVAKLYIVNDVFLVTYLILGITGNSIVIIVYSFKMKTNGDDRYFIPYLAVIDLLACTTRSSFELAMNLLPVNFRGSILCKALWFPTNVTAFSSMLLLLTISLQRYLKVCRPFGKQMILKWKRIALGLTLFLSAVLAMPLNFWNDEIPVKNTELNITGYMCEAKLEGNINPGFISFVVCITALALLIMCGLIVFNSLIGRTIYIHLKRQLKMQTDLTAHGKKANFKSKARLTFRILKKLDDPISSMSPIDKPISAKYGEQRKNPTDTLQMEQKHAFASENSAISKTETTFASEDDAKELDGKLNVTFIKLCHEKTEDKGRNAKPKKQPKNEILMPSSFRYSLMFMVIGFAFILSCLPQFIFLFAGICDTMFWNNRTNTELTIFSLLREMNVINNIVNPFVYGFFDRTFRQETKKLFKPCFCYRNCTSISDRII